MKAYRMLLLSMTAASLEACDHVSGVVPVHFAGVYVMATCGVSPETQSPPPCSTGGRASGWNYVDSGRVTFNADRTVAWMLGTHEYSCPCYLGTCSNPCTHLAGSVAEATGTYIIDGDGIVLTLSSKPDPLWGDGPTSLALKLGASIPGRVQESWRGPDSLVYSRGFSSSVRFLPQ